MTAPEFKKWLKGKGCTFRPGSSGDLIVELDGKWSTLPMPTDGRPLGSILIGNIKGALGLSDAP